MPCIARAAIIDSGNCGANGDNVIWTLDDNGTLTISGEGDMVDYNHNNYPYTHAPWEKNENLRTVIIENGVTSVGDFAFTSCSNITSVTLPDSMTELGKYAFSACNGLSYITLPDSVTTLGIYTFSGCDGLVNVTIPDNVTRIEEGTFYRCSNLTSVVIPNGVTYIGSSVFANCIYLTSINLPSSLTYIYNSAFDNTGIYNNSDNWIEDILYIDNYLITAKDNISGERTIPDGTLGIAHFAFSGCGNLTDITIPESVKFIGSGAFQSCSGLTDIIIPDGVTSIGNLAFSNCSSLTSITIGKNVAYIDPNAFDMSWGSSKLNEYNYLENIDVDKNNMTYMSIDGVLFNKINMSLVKYPAKKPVTEYKIPTGITSIDEYAFFACNNLEHINLEGITDISESAFENCTSLETIDIPKSVTNVDIRAFSECISLKTITISGNITNISSNMFSGCSALEYVELQEGITNIDWSAFYGCGNLNKIMIPKSITDIADQAFYRCDGIKEVFYAASSTEWENISIGHNNTNLTSALIHYNAVGTASPIISDTPTISIDTGTVELNIPLENVEYDSSIIAITFDNGALTGAKFETISAGDTEKDITVNAEAVKTAKVFIWDSLNGMRPLCEPKTITIE